ncbi:MAG TPA: hypothetical protein DCX78_02040, partial [Nitrospina sp.]|nr:hypothetical protein [Nitrospina sp.]
TPLSVTESATCPSGGIKFLEHAEVKLNPITKIIKPKNFLFIVYSSPKLSIYISFFYKLELKK